MSRESLPIEVEREIGRDHPPVAGLGIAERGEQRRDDSLAAEVEVEAGPVGPRLRRLGIEAEDELVRHEVRQLGELAELAPLAEGRRPARGRVRRVGPVGRACRVGRAGCQRLRDQRAVLGHRVDPHQPRRPTAGHRRQRTAAQLGLQGVAHRQQVMRRQQQEAVRRRQRVA